MALKSCVIGDCTLSTNKEILYHGLGVSECYYSKVPGYVGICRPADGVYMECLSLDIIAKARITKESFGHIVDAG